MNDTLEAPAIGHNRAPAVTDEEAVAVLDLMKRRDELARVFEELKAAPNNEATALKCVDFLKMLNAFIDTVEDKRKATKEPSLEAGRKIDALFHAVSGPCAALVPEVKKPLLAFMDWAGKEQLRSELGALGSISVRTTVESFDRKKVDLEALRPYLDAEAIKRAIRALVQATDKRKLRGAKILEKSSVTVR